MYLESHNPFASRDVFYEEVFPYEDVSQVCPEPSTERHVVSLTHTIEYLQQYETNLYIVSLSPDQPDILHNEPYVSPTPENQSQGIHANLSSPLLV